MSSVKEHYQNHLGYFYSWMAGDFQAAVKKQKDLFSTLDLLPRQNHVALDLGCAHGIHTIALSNLGYEVIAIDFNKALLEELKYNSEGLKVQAFEDDIKNVLNYKKFTPSLVVCAGDTLTHLNTYNEVEKFLEDCCDVLTSEGKLVLSFRDYSVARNGDQRFIPVKSDDTRILTCFLEYFPTYIIVTDLLYEKNNDGWVQKISSYKKLRLTDTEVEEILSSYQMKIRSSSTSQGIITIVSEK